MKYYLPSLLIPVFIIASCDRPNCHNTNPVFDKFTSDKQEYKAELVKQLQQANAYKLTYWIKGYMEHKGLPYLEVYIQGGDLCAETEFDISTSTGELQHVISVKGASYIHAELANPEYTIDSACGTYHFTLLRSGIID